jgi:hypothetical protein
MGWSPANPKAIRNSMIFQRLNEIARLLRALLQTESRDAIHLSAGWAMAADDAASRFPTRISFEGASKKHQAARPALFCLATSGWLENQHSYGVGAVAMHGAQLGICLVAE